MTRFHSVILLIFISATVAFTPNISSQQRRTLSSSALFGLAPPEVITKTKTVTKSKSKQKQKQKESVKVYEAEPDTEAKEAPLWMVFLIGDKDYKQAHVTTRLTQVLEDVNDKSAIEMFEAAQRAGEAMCGKYDQEVAEFYAEQLTRSDPIIYAEAREDKDEKD
eukprot:scaffold98770_cov60-Cyclotella_meneghiniana.AAC.1